MGNKPDRRMKACGKVPVPKPKFLSPYDPKARNTAKRSKRRTYRG